MTKETEGCGGDRGERRNGGQQRREKLHQRKDEFTGNGGVKEQEEGEITSEEG